MTTMISEVYEAFKAVGMPNDKAAAAATVLAEIWPDLSLFAAKADLASLATKADLASLATKADLAELRAATKAGVAEFETRMLTYMTALIIVAVAAIVGAIMHFMR
jgi:hypothetical protein